MLAIGLEKVCLLCVQMSEKVKQYVIQPFVSVQAIPLPTVSDFVHKQKMDSLEPVKEGWHIH